MAWVGVWCALWILDFGRRQALSGTLRQRAAYLGLLLPICFVQRVCPGTTNLITVRGVLAGSTGAILCAVMRHVSHPRTDMRKSPGFLCVDICKCIFSTSVLMIGRPEYRIACSCT